MYISSAARKEQASPSQPGCMYSSRFSGGDQLATTTQITLINEPSRRGRSAHHCLLCCASDDGTVHVCRCWGCEHHDPTVICTFQALPRRQNAALCTHWLQHQSQLLAGGRDPHVRIWDLGREQLLRSFRHGSMQPNMIQHDMI